MTQLQDDKIIEEVDGLKGPAGSKLYSFDRLLYIIR